MKERRKSERRGLNIRVSSERKKGRKCKKKKATMRVLSLWRCLSSGPAITGLADPDCRLCLHALAFSATADRARFMLQATYGAQNTVDDRRPLPGFTLRSALLYWLYCFVRVVSAFCLFSVHSPIIIFISAYSSSSLYISDPSSLTSPTSPSHSLRLFPLSSHGDHWSILGIHHQGFPPAIRISAMQHAIPPRSIFRHHLPATRPNPCQKIAVPKKALLPSTFSTHDPY